MSHQAIATGPDPDEAKWRSPRRFALLVAGAVVVVALVVAAVSFARSAASPASGAVPATVPVAVTVAHVPAKASIGVVVTLGTGEGSEWNEAAQGARVAARRLALGGADVTLFTENDGGTASGAAKAVEALAKRGVSGIVVASSGSHVDGAVQAASKAKIPVLLPYAASGGDDSWSLAPGTDSMGAGLTAALDGASTPLLVDLGGGTPDGVRVAQVVSAGAGADVATLATKVEKLVGTAGSRSSSATAAPTSTPASAAAKADAVVVSGPAAQQGAFLAALQATDAEVPIVLTSDATSPAFGAALEASGGSASGSFTTVGVDADDAVALESSAQGRAMSAFLTGVRVLSADSTAKNLTGDQSFSAVASGADSRSHDAVIALARAISSAKSIDPVKVGAALSTLTLGPADGIAGPRLDFTKRSALVGAATVLYPSGQALGLRGTAAGDEQRLIWFAETAKS